MPKRNWTVEPFELHLDPDDLARFAADPEPDDPGPEEDNAEAARETWLAQIAPVLHRLPVKEQDLIDLYFFKRCRQQDIAEIFEVTQAAISYRLQRAAVRLQFLLRWPGVVLTRVDLDRDLGPLWTEHRCHFFDPDGIEILWSLLQTTCDSATAKQLGLTQGHVHYRLHRSTDFLTPRPERAQEVRTRRWGREISPAKPRPPLGPEHERYRVAFQMLCDHRRILHAQEWRPGRKPAARKREASI